MVEGFCYSVEREREMTMIMTEYWNLELHAAANSWKILDITLEKGRIFHVVIPLQ